MLSRTDNQQINGGSARENFTLSPKQKEIKVGKFFPRENNGDITAENKSI